VALGDEKQVQSIEAAPLVDLARRALGRKNVPEILTTKRQKTKREQEIVGLLRQRLPNEHGADQPYERQSGSSGR